MSNHETKITSILLVRHGKTETTGEILPGRTPKLFLDSEGERQAQATGTYINRTFKNISQIQASPLERTQQTAEFIAKEVSLGYEKNSSIIEADFGDWTGKKLKDLRELTEWQQVQTHPASFTFPNGESFGQIQTRVVTEIYQLAKNNLGTTIILVSHADVIKAALNHFVGAHLDMFQRIHIDTCSISRIDFYGHKAAVSGINQLAYL